MYTDTGWLADATYLYNSATCSKLAAAGWYSTGAVWREWNGIAFVSGGFCGFE
jgi:hypothetical protein